MHPPWMCAKAKLLAKQIGHRKKLKGVLGSDNVCAASNANENESGRKRRLVAVTLTI
jgi:hypothetical protein